jgi:hypothetical protein
MLSWLNSNQKHVEKYCSVYTKQGFDILIFKNRIDTVTRPRTMQKIAGNFIKFVEDNESYDRILLHGFSMGGYAWCECLIHLHEQNKFEAIAKRIQGQVWDSGA